MALAPGASATAPLRPRASERDSVPVYTERLSADREGQGEHSLMLLKLPGGPSRGVVQRNVTLRSPSPFPKSVTSYVDAAPTGFRTNPPSALALRWTRWDRSHVPLTFTNVAVNDQPERGNSTMTSSGAPTSGGGAGGRSSAHTLPKQYAQAFRSSDRSPYRIVTGGGSSRSSLPAPSAQVARSSEPRRIDPANPD